MYGVSLKIKTFVLMLIYVLIAAVVVFTVVSTKGFGLIKTKSGSASGWNAVFMTNGQVYFGHLAKMDNQFSILTDVYYLQVDQQKDLQPEKNSSTTTEQPKLSLIKLGNELHGPSDEMKINRDQILFVEEMKSDSKVVSAIDEYIKNPPAVTK